MAKNSSYVFVSFLFWGVLVLASHIWNHGLMKDKIYNQATDRAQFVFKMVESARLWNARHDGVYVPINEHSMPNQYLKITKRDINSTDGMHLTMINPAYMTRQLVDVVAELSDLRLHLTSLKLLNPNNKPDEWERAQLVKFENGKSFFSEFIESDQGTVFRYMAPLKIDETCLRCHSHQNYKIGDVRGGLSVSFKAEPLLEIESAQMKNIAFTHIIVWILLSILTALFVNRLQNNIKNLEAEKKRVEELVEIRTKELKKVFYAMEFSPASVVITDQDGNIEYVNPKFSELTGYSKEEAIGSNPRILQSGKMDHGFYAEFWRHILSKKEWQGELINKTKDGREYIESARISPIIDNNGVITHFIAIKEDITLKKAQEAQIIHAARHDSLTDLPNRKYFDELIRAKSDDFIALLYIDLDGFKQVNDSLGHQFGDLLLKEASLRLKSSIRKSDIVARLGGDEFAIVMSSGVSIEGAKELASKIVKEMARVFVLEGKEVVISASIGVSFSQKEKPVSTLIKEADQAMYQAKEAGKNSYKIYDQES